MAFNIRKTTCTIRNSLKYKMKIFKMVVHEIFTEAYKMVSSFLLQESFKKCIEFILKSDSKMN